ncbi:Chromatin modification-related protein png1 [Termitomyces sp. J132]|nr:Chromatin modification-related protein png1 [Termitomyces sp. J132]
MPPSRNSAVVAANDPADNPPYSLALLSEYTHTLDALPLELSRNFADLRELDAVLSSSMASLTSKINKLTLMIENKEDKQERLWLLAEIADEAARLKLGGDDKIRVACQAADNLKYNMAHLKNLTEHIPNFDPSTLDRKTTYPHVSARSFMPALPPENTRRRRGGYGSLLTSAPDPSPAKKRQRVLQRDDDLDIMRSPKKDKNELNARSRARAKKNDRPASPSESLVSVTSHVLPPTNGISSYRGAANGASARGAGSAAGSKRSRPSAGNRSATPHAGDPYEQNGMHPNGHGGNSRRDAYSVPQSSHHASLPHPYQNGDTGDAGDGEGDGDDRRYCFCNGISYGEMIACDDSQCEREWFHLACIGLVVPPEGRWFCDACRNKRNAKRSGRGGKRRAGGGRAGTRAS